MGIISTRYITSIAAAFFFLQQGKCISALHDKDSDLIASEDEFNQKEVRVLVWQAIKRQRYDQWDTYQLLSLITDKERYHLWYPSACLSPCLCSMICWRLKTTPRKRSKRFVCVYMSKFTNLIQCTYYILWYHCNRNIPFKRSPPNYTNHIYVREMSFRLLIGNTNQTNALSSRALVEIRRKINK